MRGQHPLWRGFYLAAALTALRFFLGEMDPLSAFRAERRALIFCGALLLGGLLGALPSWLRKAPLPRLTNASPRRLGLCFACGAAMTLGLGLAGRGSVLAALLTGSAGAYGFCLMALAAGFAAVRLLERRAKA